ncbi:MAG: hypothetical protein FD166_3394 [Bacteroidetes bacterium]|nr:MAG: hypothetical protein FD166_3394 [Bacteroidota bacterium]
MKTARLISFTLILTLSGLFCSGQVRVIGHASAEVVESVSASCSSNTDITLSAQEITDFDLGSFSISGNAKSTCSLIIGNANVSNNRGESFTIQTTTPEAGMPLIADENGNHSLNLIASPGELLASGQYQGNYGVTFAYN